MKTEENRTQKNRGVKFVCEFEGEMNMQRIVSMNEVCV
jgi:hypothetical protein